MIVTNCPDCSTPGIYTVMRGQTGVYAPQECAECGCEYVVEVTRTDGTTYPRDDFENDILPELEGIELVKSPSGKSELYCDPDKLTWL